jgi:hypothetical protein
MLGNARIWTKKIFSPRSKSRARFTMARRLASICATGRPRITSLAPSQMTSAAGFTSGRR